MAVRTDNITFCDLSDQLLQRYATSHAAQVADLLAADVIEVHAFGREGSSTVGAGCRFQIIKVLLACMGTLLGVRRVATSARPA